MNICAYITKLHAEVEDMYDQNCWFISESPGWLNQIRNQIKLGEKSVLSRSRMFEGQASGFNSVASLQISVRMFVGGTGRSVRLGECRRRLHLQETKCGEFRQESCCWSKQEILGWKWILKAGNAALKRQKNKHDGPFLFIFYKLTHFLRSCRLTSKGGW